MKLETSNFLMSLMTINAKKSVGASVALILLGILVLLTGEKSLLVVVPAAVLVWFGVAPKLRNTRN